MPKVNSSLKKLASHLRSIEKKFLWFDVNDRSVESMSESLFLKDESFDQSVFWRCVHEI